jgi:AcrR family transcriptional regulator
MPRQGLDRARVVRAAAALADAEGIGAVTLARVAAELGVRSPSLYNHVDGLEGLRRGIALLALGELGAALREAATGRAGEDALVALAQAYREYARAHPGRYPLTQYLPQPKDPEVDAAAGAVVQIVVDGLRAFGLAGDDAIHAVRGFRAAIHGFVSLEAGGGFGIPVDVDESFRRLVSVLAAGLGAGGVPAGGVPGTFSRGDSDV